MNDFSSRPSGTGVVIGSLLLAAVLTVAPWPDGLAWLRPQWLLLVLLYWVVTLPHRIGVFWGFVVGLFQDVLLNTPMGQHALAMTLLCYVTLLAYRRIRRANLLLQSGVFFGLSFLYVAINGIIQASTGRGDLLFWSMPAAALACAVVWIPVSSLLQFVRLRFLVK